MLRRVVLLVIMFLCAACTPMPVQDVIILGPENLARTTCFYGFPVTVMRGGMPTIDSLAIEAHEKVHRDQMRGQCDYAISRYSHEPRFALRMERDGYLAQIRVYPRHQWEGRWAITRLALIHYFALALDSDTAAMILNQAHP